MDDPFSWEKEFTIKISKSQNFGNNLLDRLKLAKEKLAPIIHEVKSNSSSRQYNLGRTTNSSLSITKQSCAITNDQYKEVLLASELLQTIDFSLKNRDEYGNIKLPNAEVIVANVDLEYETSKLGKSRIICLDSNVLGEIVDLYKQLGEAIGRLIIEANTSTIQGTAEITQSYKNMGHQSSAIAMPDSQAVIQQKQQESVIEMKAPQNEESTNKMSPSASKVSRTSGKSSGRKLDDSLSRIISQGKVHEESSKIISTKSTNKTKFNDSISRLVSNENMDAKKSQTAPPQSEKNFTSQLTASKISKNEYQTSASEDMNKNVIEKKSHSSTKRKSSTRSKSVPKTSSIKVTPSFKGSESKSEHLMADCCSRSRSKNVHMDDDDKGVIYITIKCFSDLDDTGNESEFTSIPICETSCPDSEGSTHVHIKLDGNPVTVKVHQDKVISDGVYCVDTDNADDDNIKIMIKKCPECFSTLLASTSKIESVHEFQQDGKATQKNLENSHESITLHGKTINENPEIFDVLSEDEISKTIIATSDNEDGSSDAKKMNVLLDPEEINKSIIGFNEEIEKTSKMASSASVIKDKSFKDYDDESNRKKSSHDRVPLKISEVSVKSKQSIEIVKRGSSHDGVPRKISESSIKTKNLEEIVEKRSKGEIVPPKISKASLKSLKSRESFKKESSKNPKQSIPLTRGKICSSLEFDVTVVETRLRSDGIDHPNAGVVVNLKELGVNQLLRACRPAKCCRKAILDEKNRKALPYAVSLKSLPLVPCDLDVIEQSIDMSVRKIKNSINLCQDYKNKMAYYVSLGRNDFKSNINFPWVLPTYDIKCVVINSDRLAIEEAQSRYYLLKKIQDEDDEKFYVLQKIEEKVKRINKKNFFHPYRRETVKKKSLPTENSEKIQRNHKKTLQISRRVEVMECGDGPFKDDSLQHDSTLDLFHNLDLDFVLGRKSTTDDNFTNDFPNQSTFPQRLDKFQDFRATPPDLMDFFWKPHQTNFIVGMFTYSQNPVPPDHPYSMHNPETDPIQLEEWAPHMVSVTSLPRLVEVKPMSRHTRCIACQHKIHGTGCGAPKCRSNEDFGDSETGISEFMQQGRKDEKTFAAPPKAKSLAKPDSGSSASITSVKSYENNRRHSRCKVCQHKINGTDCGARKYRSNEGLEDSGTGISEFMELGRNDEQTFAAPPKAKHTTRRDDGSNTNMNCGKSYENSKPRKCRISNARDRKIRIEIERKRRDKNCSGVPSCPKDCKNQNRDVDTNGRCNNRNRGNNDNREVYELYSGKSQNKNFKEKESQFTLGSTDSLEILIDNKGSVKVQRRHKKDDDNRKRCRE